MMKYLLQFKASAGKEISKADIYNRSHLNAEQIMRIQQNRTSALTNRRRLLDEQSQSSQEHKSSNIRPFASSPAKDKSGYAQLPMPVVMQHGIVPLTSRPTSLRLAIRNAHDRDARIVFTESSHTYVLDDLYQFPISISGVWPKFFDHFDPKAVVDLYFDRWAINPDSKYYDIIQSQRCFFFIKVTMTSRPTLFPSGVLQVLPHPQGARTFTSRSSSTAMR